MTYFRKNPDRSVSSEVRILKVNPFMDIVALALANGDIVLHRLLSWQRVWSIHAVKELKSEDNKVVDFDWSPDGKYLAVIYNGYFEEDKNVYPTYLDENFRSVQTVSNGSTAVPASRGSRSKSTSSNNSMRSSNPTAIVLYDIETVKMISTRNSDLTLRSIYWQHRDPGGPTLISLGSPGESLLLPLDTLEIPFMDLFADEDEFQSFISTTGKLNFGGNNNSQDSSKNGKKGAASRPSKTYHHYGGTSKSLEDYERMKLFGHQAGSVRFNVLITGSVEGYIDVLAFGYYRLLRIDLNALQVKSRPSLKIHQLWISSDLAIMNLITELPSSEQSQLMTLSCRLLSTKWRELYAFIRIKAQLDVRLEFLFDTLKEISSIWEDLIAEVDSKLSNYVQRDEEEDTKDDPFKPRSNKIKLEPNEFIEMLVFGEISMNLERFLTDLTEKGLKKLAYTIETSFVDIHRANIEKVQRALFHVLSLLNVLKGMALHDIQFGDLFLSVPMVNTFYRETLAMLIKTVQLQQNLNDSMKKTRAFIRWLHKCIHMVTNSGDANTTSTANNAEESSTPNYVLTTQDLNLIMNFLRENSLTNGFKFENIAFFLRKTRVKASINGGFPNSSGTPGTFGSGGRKVSQKLKGALRSSRSSLTSRKSKSPGSFTLGSAKKSTASPKTAKSKGSQAQKSQNGTKPSEISVPYKEFLKEQRLKQFLETLSQIKDSEVVDTDEILSQFFPNRAVSSSNISSSLDQLNLEDVKQFERDLFDESGDIDQLHESAHSQYSLYEHLYRIYEQFRALFDAQSGERMNRAVMDQLIRDKEVRSVLVEDEDGRDAEQNDSPRFGDFCSQIGELEAINSNWSYVLLTGGTKRADFPSHFTLIRSNRLVLFSMSSNSLDTQSSEFEFAHFAFTARGRRSGVKQTRYLTVQAAKFYNDEYVTLVLSDPSGPRKKKVQVQDGIMMVGAFGDADTSKKGEMSIDDQEMLSEDEDVVPTNLNASTSSEIKNGGPHGGEQMPETTAQYLVQLKYIKIWPGLEDERLGRVQGTGPAAVAKNVDASSVEIKQLVLLDLTNKLMQSRPKGMELDPDDSLEDLMDVDDDDQEEGDDDADNELLDLDNHEDLVLVRYLGEGTDSIHLASSGLRKVACIGHSRTKCAVYEMDVSEDEDEGEQVDGGVTGEQEEFEQEDDEEGDDRDHGTDNPGIDDTDDQNIEENGFGGSRSNGPDHDEDGELVPDAGTEEIIGDDPGSDADMLTADLTPMGPPPGTSGVLNSTLESASSPLNDTEADGGPKSFGYRSGKNRNVIEMAAPLVPGVDSAMNPIPGPSTAKAHPRQSKSFIRIEQQMLKRDDIHIKSEPED